MVAAPADHWVHEYHEFDRLKDQTNPYMGEEDCLPVLQHIGLTHNFLPQICLTWQDIWNVFLGMLAAVQSKVDNAQKACLLPTFFATLQSFHTSMLK